MRFLFTPPTDAFSPLPATGQPQTRTASSEQGNNKKRLEATPQLNYLQRQTWLFAENSSTLSHGQSGFSPHDSDHEHHVRAVGKAKPSMSHPASRRTTQIVSQLNIFTHSYSFAASGRPNACAKPCSETRCLPVLPAIGLSLKLLRPSLSSSPAPRAPSP